MHLWLDFLQRRQSLFCFVGFGEIRLLAQTQGRFDFAARAELVRDAFTQLALPQAALRLKQGFGRLIRRSSDRGAVVILDNRILGRDYGKAFLDVLPPASRFVGPSAEISEQVGEWLQ